MCFKKVEIIEVEPIQIFKKTINSCINEKDVDVLKRSNSNIFYNNLDKHFYFSYKIIKFYKYKKIKKVWHSINLKKKFFLHFNLKKKIVLCRIKKIFNKWGRSKTLFSSDHFCRYIDFYFYISKFLKFTYYFFNKINRKISCIFLKLNENFYFSFSFVYFPKKAKWQFWSISKKRFLNILRSEEFFDPFLLLLWSKATKIIIQKIFFLINL